MVGLPGTGKSTWVKMLLDKNPTYVLVSSDDLIEKYAAQDGLTYSDVFQKYIGKATHEMKRIAKEAFENNNDIIWDQTNLTIKSRKEKLSLAQKHGYTVEAVVFNLTDAEHKKRIKERTDAGGKTIPNNIINDMARKFQMPSKDEGIKKITIIRE